MAGYVWQLADYWRRVKIGGASEHRWIRYISNMVETIASLKQSSVPYARGMTLSSQLGLGAVAVCLSFIAWMLGPWTDK